MESFSPSAVLPSPMKPFILFFCCGCSCHWHWLLHVVILFVLKSSFGWVDVDFSPFSATVCVRVVCVLCVYCCFVSFGFVSLGFPFLISMVHMLDLCMRSLCDSYFAAATIYFFTASISRISLSAIQPIYLLNQPICSPPSNKLIL